MNTPTLSRRHFLQGAGALLVGFNFAGGPLALAARTVEPRAAIDKPLGTDRVHAWLAVTDDGRVIVYSGKVELGTGVETALRQIVADALAVHFDTTEIVQGDTALTPDQGYTAGSKTIQQGGARLRAAAATARGLLLAKAADRLDVASSRLVAADGEIRVDGDKSRVLRYADLIDEAGFDAPVDSDAEAPEARRFVGRSVPRVDIPDKVAGRFNYLQDLRLADMWHARVVRPPTTGTVRTPAVASIDRDSVGKNVEIVQRGAFVAVAAATEWAAMQAADDLSVQWADLEPMPDADTPFAAFDAAAGTGRVSAEAGDVEAALGDGDDVLSAEYDWPFQIHDSIGPSCALADVREDSATIWSATQGVYPLRSALADLLDRDERAVRVIYVEGSGCYGHNGADDVAADAALVSQAIGRPVRLQWSRADEHGWAPKGPAMRMQLRGRVKDGRVAAWAFENLTPSHLTRPGGGAGARNVLAGNLVHGTHASDRYVGGDRNAPADYRFDAYRVSTRWVDVADALLRCSALRTLGAIQNSFANESFIDELAAAAERDPVAFRLDHLDDPRARAVIETVADRAGWQARVSPQRREDSAPTPRTGRGMAFARYENEFAYVAVVAEVEVSDGDGIRVRRVVVAHDCGLIVNPDGLENQIEGNVMQAVGRTLKEAVTWDRTGVTSLDWAGYPILTFPEMPEVEIALIDRPDQPSTGAGEPASVPIPAAIANAVFDATGQRLRAVPLRWNGSA
ncbi:xanthine dehydrogenase family protein molybdopterin-binding subunit [Salinisphaera orenii]|uniref:Isoquinoline 1-oxidoreductase subunit beta n=1 Tax=Salinisphaera orenii YIM 95161 TaxID=1051139 RepID=A0A423QA85_9GAMM|nr:molybdopterin cofactor-binding domain-containing protein [Salinisphaera halophila]ROO37505.1 isoquinoline 1-oxidoreductase subunit beta [Salinisphaera halophila YIM 95161]